MKPNITTAQVRAVLDALAEEFLVDIPAIWDKDGVSTIEFTVLANHLVNSDDAWYEGIADHINATN